MNIREREGEDISRRRFSAASLIPDGPHISASVQDEHNRYDFAQRSDGFKRFVSFLLLVSTLVKTKQLENVLLLIDEPEISLHPTGARYLRDELIRISKTNWVVYSTHSIFMRPLKNPAEARVPPGASCAVRFAGQGGSRRPAWRPPSIPLGGRSGHPPARPSPLRRSPPPSRADPPPGGGASRCASRSRRSPPGEAGSSPWEASSSAPGRGPGGA